MQAKRNRIATVATIALGLFPLLAPRPCAGLSMGVSPMKLHLTIEPGQSQSVAVEVYSTSEEPIRVVAYNTDWVTTPDGEISFRPLGTPERSAAAWVAPDLSEFSLSGSGSQIVRIKAEMPDSASGSYWTIVFFEGQGEVHRGRLALSAKARMGVTVYLTAAGTDRYEFALAGMDVLPNQEGGFDLLASLANRGNAHTYPIGWFQVLDPSGGVLHEEKTPLRVSLPDRQTIYRLSWKPDAPGRRQLVVTFDCGVETLVQGIKKFSVSADRVIARPDEAPGAIQGVD